MAKIDLLQGLNPEQKKAVLHDEGPLLVIAGAGTGKTTVIARRIAHLITSKKAKPEEILALTFTDKAAAKMEEEVDILLPYGFADIRISTFHAFGDMALRENALDLGLDPDFKVLTTPQQIIFFREHLFEFPIKHFRPLSNPTRYIEAMVRLFSRARDEDVSPAEYVEFAHKLTEQAAEAGDPELMEIAEKQTEVAMTYKKYQEIMSHHGKIDFGNQVFLALQLFRKHSSILKEFQERFKYILVDEFQDTNFAQFQLVNLLASRYNNITAVGDDDQAIYRFRGAAISNILGFLERYPKAKNVVLIKNYRSTQVILDSAYKLIKHNNPERLEVKSGIDKHIVGLTDGGKTVEHLHFDTVSAEADGVATMIHDKTEKGTYKYGDFAILVRSNNDADPFLRAMNMKGIPWRFTGNEGLYSRPEVRLSIAFLRVASNVNDDLSVYHMASSDIYKIGMPELTSVMHSARKTNTPLYRVLKSVDSIEELSAIPEGERKKMGRLVSDMDKYSELSRTLTTGRLLYRFLTETKYISNLVRKEDADSEEMIQNIAKFFDIVHEFETLTEEDRAFRFVPHLDMLIKVGDNPAVAEADMDTDAVNVLTIHKAKGLEFTVVFLVSLVMGKFPWPRRRASIELPEEAIKYPLPSGDFHIQEERRLFYVGMTRAKKEIYFTSARDYGGTRTRKISQFIYETMGINREAEKTRKLSPIEAINRFAPPAKSGKKELEEIPDDKIITLSFRQVDDYTTCPLKYKYVHIMRIPVLQHHAIVYGKAMHDAVQLYFRRKMKKRKVRLEEMINVFHHSWISEGFLTREHEEQRLEAGRSTLRAFFEREEGLSDVPTDIEQPFSFLLDNDRITGRWDRIDIKDGKVRIIDFKTSEVKNQKKADKQVKDSIQLSVYALAHKHINGTLPDSVELHFLETGLVGKDTRSEEDLEETIELIKRVSRGIRSRNFEAKPGYNACSYCPYNQVCQYTATSRLPKETVGAEVN
ncbi:MAG: hypothetical protein AUJ75_01625 [Candidatus Omnitrophica bacterium CG1_02_49_10]|nr:MAG: hypothetical protein AUJ75_01625 [Candidatus Omnitrophica bacterium CG1_02_49_10]